MRFSQAIADMMQVIGFIGTLALIVLGCSVIERWGRMRRRRAIASRMHRDFGQWVESVDRHGATLRAMERASRAQRVWELYGPDATLEDIEGKELDR